MRKLLLVTVAGVLAVAALGCSSGDADEEGAASADHGEVALDEAVAAETESGGAEDAVAVAQPAQEGSSLPAVGPRVVQTASLALSVPRNEFDSTVSKARSIATGLGGFVVSSSASQGSERRLESGTLVVRVPERSYAQAIARFSDLGRVEGREETGQDVSQELVDLEARARHLGAVERQLLALLEKAETVPAALAVQSQLNQVQLELEQARGRLVYLEDQVAYATISLDVRERQAAVAGDDGGPWSIVDAWKSAAHGFLTVVGWILVAAATIAPVVLLLLLGLLGGRLVLRRGLPGLRRPSA